MAAARTLHVRCATWEQVEVFHTRKLRRGKLLSMKVPFHAAIGTPVTLSLELPNDVVIAIDGSVQKASPVEGALDPSGKPEGGKTWIEVELSGFTDEVVARIKAMASGVEAEPAPAPAPPQRPSKIMAVAEELPADERQLFQHLTSELRRMRQAAVHEVLGVERDADADAVKTAWMNLVRRHHPDLVARRKAPALTHLAEELTILSNRAYDRLRSALVSEGRATALGPALKAPAGWLVGFDDIASSEKPRAAKPAGRAAKVATIPPPIKGSPSSGAGAGGETFETRARAMLMQGDPNTAQEVLAAALVVYPRSKPLRSLYYVASAVAALDKGELMLATSQLETALAHHEQCTEAARILEHLRRHEGADQETIRRLFR